MAQTWGEPISPPSETCVASTNFLIGTPIIVVATARRVTRQALMGFSQVPPHSGVAVEVPGRERGMPGRAPGPGAVPRLLERDGIGRFMRLRSFIDRGNHEPVRSVYLAILAVKCALLAVRCSVHERKWPARPTDRTQAAALTAWSPQIGIPYDNRQLAPVADLEAANSSTEVIVPPGS
jgi:hypothetical protein